MDAIEAVAGPSDVAASSLGASRVEEWCVTEAEPVSSSITSQLCAECLRILGLVQTHLASSKRYPTSTVRRYDRLLAAFILWTDGYDIVEGGLDRVLEESRVLQRSLLQCLTRISGALLNDVIPMLGPVGLGLQSRRIARLQAAHSDAEVAVTVTSLRVDFSQSDSDSDTSSGSDSSFAQVREVASSTRVSRSAQRVSAPRAKRPARGACLTCDTHGEKCGEEQPDCNNCANAGRTCRWWAAQHVVPIKRGSSQEGTPGQELKRKQLGETFANDDLEEIVADLETDIRCLRDLGPLIDSPFLDSSSLRGTVSLPVAELSWKPYQTYSDRISHRFPKALHSLVDRLGKANLDRFKRTQEQKLANANEQQQEQAKTQPANDSASFVGGSSNYHDSALGTSIATGSIYAETIMAYGKDGAGAVRIPPLSSTAKLGIPFECLVCGRGVSIRSNRAWKKHLWKDLRPWICHDATCQFGDEPFSSQEDWVQHLSLDHGMGGDWKPIECPLCFELTGEGKSAITRHLAVHMEEISLAALPNRGDSEDGSNAGDDADSAIEDRASSIGSEETGRQNDLGPEHEHVQLGSEETVRIISSMMAVHDRLNEALYQNRSLESLKAVALTAEDLIEVTTERISMGSRHTASNADLMHLESRLQGIRALAEQARSRARDIETQSEAPKSSVPHLYHCPWEGDPSCNHKPSPNKADLRRFTDSHTKRYRCPVAGCEDVHFSSDATRLRHQQELHGMTGGHEPETRIVCTVEGCQRSDFRHGFLYQSELRDHLEQAHEFITPRLPPLSIPIPGGFSSQVPPPLPPPRFLEVPEEEFPVPDRTYGLWPNSGSDHMNIPSSSATVPTATGPRGPAKSAKSPLRIAQLMETSELDDLDGTSTDKDTTLQRPPRLARTMTDIYSDELYYPNHTTASATSTHQNQMATSTPINDVFEQRVRAANSLHLSEEEIMASRTISPKDAMLDFHEGDNSFLPLFPQEHTTRASPPQPDEVVNAAEEPSRTNSNSERNRPSQSDQDFSLYSYWCSQPSCARSWPGQGFFTNEEWLHHRRESHGLFVSVDQGAPEDDDSERRTESERGGWDDPRSPWTDEEPDPERHLVYTPDEDEAQRQIREMEEEDAVREGEAAEFEAERRERAIIEMEDGATIRDSWEDEELESLVRERMIREAEEERQISEIETEGRATSRARLEALYVTDVKPAAVGPEIDEKLQYLADMAQRRLRSRLEERATALPSDQQPSSSASESTGQLSRNDKGKQRADYPEEHNLDDLHPIEEEVPSSPAMQPVVLRTLHSTRHHYTTRYENRPGDPSSSADPFDTVKDAARDAVKNAMEPVQQQPSPPLSGGYVCAFDGCEAAPFRNQDLLNSHVAEAHKPQLQQRAPHAPASSNQFQLESLLRQQLHRDWEQKQQHKQQQQQQQPNNNDHDKNIRLTSQVLYNKGIQDLANKWGGAAENIPAEQMDAFKKQCITQAKDNMQGIIARAQERQQQQAARQ